jgi:Nuclease-related domain/AAA domain/UvrD-like helicase C-terminal domain
VSARGDVHGLRPDLEQRRAIVAALYHRRMSRGEDAERLVEERLRAALPDTSYRLYVNVNWTGPVTDHGPARDGEADAVITHPEHGLLVLEVKSGEPRIDPDGHWHLGPIELKQSPFEQARTSKHHLRAKLVDLPDWPAHVDPLAGHAVALPDVDLESLPRGHSLFGLGPDAPTDLVLDARSLETVDGIQRWLDHVFEYWTGDGSGRYEPLGEKGVKLVHELLRPTVSLHRLVRGRIEDDRAALVDASRAQSRILNQWKSLRQVEVVGPAGSGKSMLAAERARRLAAEGYRTLLVCFNQRLATTMQRDLAQAPSPAGLEVTTFHRLCELLGQAAGTLPARPDPIPQTWWDQALPDALDAAISADDEERFHAVIVDEGQDFALGWLESLQLLLRDTDHGVFWVFHDPAQALFRPDVVTQLGLERLELFEDHRNPPLVARLASRFRDDDTEIEIFREEGLPAEVVAAAAGAPTVEAVRTTLHRLIVEERVPEFRIAVLSGLSPTKSDVWRQRRFGNTRLWNEALDDEGRSKGLPPEAVPDEPGDVVLFETIRRFKGLEREVIVLCELPEDAGRLDELLYVGLTRATTHLVAIAPDGLARRLRGAE